MLYYYEMSFVLIAELGGCGFKRCTKYEPLHSLINFNLSFFYDLTKTSSKSNQSCVAVYCWHIARVMQRIIDHSSIQSCQTATLCLYAQHRRILRPAF